MLHLNYILIGRGLNLTDWIFAREFQLIPQHLMSIYSANVSYLQKAVSLVLWLDFPFHVCPKCRTILTLQLYYYKQCILLYLEYSLYICMRTCAYTHTTDSQATFQTHWIRVFGVEAQPSVYFTYSTGYDVQSELKNHWFMYFQRMKLRIREIWRLE